MWRVADLLHIRGLSVTAPHSRPFEPSWLGVTPRSRPPKLAIPSPVREYRGRGPGTNTDVEGFLAPLAVALGGTIPSGLRVTVVGAGGAARSIVHALKTVDAHLLILNRTGAKARELAREFSCEYAGLDAEGTRVARGYSDLIVQTTSAGMAPDTTDPAPTMVFDGTELVYDLVYAPPVTPFTRRARAAGCSIIPGIQMLVSQAMRQFLLFTGMSYPEGLRHALEQRLD